MNIRRYAPFAALLAFGLGSSLQAYAAPIVENGTFSADNSVYSYDFSPSSTTSYTFTTTSFASGGFLPVLTLFNATSGLPVDYSNSGLGDVSLSDTLNSGSYILDLTEFPNVANGSLSDGFLFASDPPATGDACGGALTGMSFIISITCSPTPLGKNFTVDIASAGSIAVTPEPPTWLLMLPSLAMVIAVSHRRSA
jgi:hypothetical protein